MDPNHGKSRRKIIRDVAKTIEPTIDARIERIVIQKIEERLSARKWWIASALDAFKRGKS